MPKKQDEARLKNALVEGFETFTGKCGWFNYNLATMHSRLGVPDLVFVLDGHTAWLEAKVGDDGLSSYQAHQADRLAKNGARVLVLRCPAVTKRPRDSEFMLTLYRTGDESPILRTGFWHDFSTAGFWLDALEKVLP